MSLLLFSTSSPSFASSFTKHRTSSFTTHRRNLMNNLSVLHLVKEQRARHLSWAVLPLQLPLQLLLHHLVIGHPAKDEQVLQTGQRTAQVSGEDRAVKLVPAAGLLVKAVEGVEKVGDALAVHRGDDGQLFDAGKCEGVRVVRVAIGLEVERPVEFSGDDVQFSQTGHGVQY